MIEVTQEFEQWFKSLTDDERIAVAAKVDLLEQIGPSLGRPNADTLRKSKYANFKELRIQRGGDPYRVIFAFDQRRVAILLLGGKKSDDGWYESAIPQAEKIYERYFIELKNEGLL